MRPTLLFALIAAFALTACEKKPEAPKDAGTAAVSVDATVAVVTGDAGVAVATADAGAKHEMGNCPTAVANADLAIKDVAGGVEISVTGKDEATTREIRERVKKLTDAEKNDAGGGARHNHSGAGGGKTGRCTIVNRNTKVTAAEIPNGSKITVLVNDKGELDWLRRETRERDTEAKSAIAQGAGALRMVHCPSAVDGATTGVKDTKDGVVVTIVGPADKTEEIRARAKHTADVAKKTMGPTLQHSGEGTGGGGVGRCPIVVEGETKVDLKDIPNGVEATVTTTKGVPALQQETKDRAASFVKK